MWRARQDLNPRPLGRGRSDVTLLAEISDACYSRKFWYLEILTSI